MGDWSSFEKNKKINDAWLKFLKESQGIEEGFMDAVRGFKKGAKHGARSVLGLGPDEEDEIRSTGLAYKKPKTKKVDTPAAQTDGAQADTELPPEQPEPELQLKDLEATPPAKPGDLPDIYAGMSDEEMKAQQQTRNLSDRLRAMVDNYEKQGLPKSAAVKAAVKSTQAGKLGSKLTHDFTTRAKRKPGEHVVGNPVSWSGVKFEDMGQLTNLAVQVVLKQMDKDDLVLALYGASSPLRDLVLANVSSRAANDIREKFIYMDHIPASRVRKAQKTFIATAIKLAEDGSIYLPFSTGRQKAKKARPVRVRGKGKTIPKADAPELTRAQRRKKKSKGPGTVRRAGGSKGMPAQPQSRSRKNVRENLDLTLKDLIKEELLRVINEEE